MTTPTLDQIQITRLLIENCEGCGGVGYFHRQFAPDEEECSACQPLRASLIEGGVG